MGDGTKGRRSKTRVTKSAIFIQAPKNICDRGAMLWAWSPKLSPTASALMWNTLVTSTRSYSFCSVFTVVISQIHPHPIFLKIQPFIYDIQCRLPRLKIRAEKTYYRPGQPSNSINPDLPCEQTLKWFQSWRYIIISLAPVTLRHDAPPLSLSKLWAPWAGSCSQAKSIRTGGNVNRRLWLRGGRLRWTTVGGSWGKQGSCRASGLWPSPCRSDVMDLRGEITNDPKYFIRLMFYAALGHLGCLKALLNSAVLIAKFLNRFFWWGRMGLGGRSVWGFVQRMCQV